MNNRPMPPQAAPQAQANMPANMPGMPPQGMPPQAQPPGPNANANPMARQQQLAQMLRGR